MNLRQLSVKQKRWAIGMAVALVLYAAAGFWLVPAVVRSQLTGFAQTELGGRRASAGDISFNPFTLRLQATDLRLQEASGAPLFAIAGLDVEMQWRSLLRRAWSFAHIRITEPAASLTVAPDGTFNFAQLLDTLNKRPRDKNPDAGLPRLVIGHFALERGLVDMRDRRAGYANVFSPIEFSLDQFSTLPQEKDSYAFSAESARGGKLRWKGTASVDPIQASGELVLEGASLPQLAVYLKSYTRATVAAGQLDANIPYRFAYADGKLDARLENARVALRDLAVAREGAKDSFAALTRLEVNGIAADLVRREATVREVRADGGKLSIVRDAKGQLDLATLLIETAGPAPAAKAPVPVMNWKVAVNQVLFDKLAFDALDETVTPALRVTAGKVSMQMQLAAQQAGADLQVTAGNAAFAMADLAVTSGGQSPLKVSQLGFADGSVDLAARRAEVGRAYVDGAQVQVTRDRKGELNWMQLLPKAPAAPAAPASAVAAPWTAVARTVEVGKIDADVADEASGLKVRVNGLRAKLEGASTDLKKAVKFSAGLSLREGGQLSAQGSVVPATNAVTADVGVQGVALAPLQPLLSQYVKLKIAGGNVSAKGRLTTGGAGTARSPTLRFAGSFDVGGLVLNEDDGDLFVEERGRKQPHCDARPQPARRAGAATAGTERQADHRG